MQFAECLGRFYQQGIMFRRRGCLYSVHALDDGGANVAQHNCGPGRIDHGRIRKTTGLEGLQGVEFATQQAGWPTGFGLQAEGYDAITAMLTAAGIRYFTPSPFQRLDLREAIVFVLVAVIIVPFATAPWGAAITVAYGFSSDFWAEWRNLGVSNGVTVIVLVPAIMMGIHSWRDGRFFDATPARVAETVREMLG